MKVLILSCNTGEGHNAAGHALEEELERRGHQVHMLDIMLLAGRRVSRLVGGGYVGIVKHTPRFFHLLYRAGEKISSANRKSPVYYANALLAKRLRAYLDEHGFDIIVTPHLFPAETLTCLKRKGELKQRVVAVSTDYTCIPFWEETACDYYVIPHADLATEYAQKGIPAERLRPYGIPVRAPFLVQKSKRQARLDCGLPETGALYLIMSGSMGFGKMAVFTAMLAAQMTKQEQAVVICGTNRKMELVLKTQFKERRNIHIIGYTDQVADYMAACDVVFTKPGGLTTSEAAVKRVPIVHTSPIPGCESRNLLFFTERGMSVSGTRMRDQIEAGRALAAGEAAREEMIQAQCAHISRQAAADTVSLLETLSRKEGG